MASKGKSDHNHREAPEAKDGDVARVQMDFTFVGAEGIFVNEPRAKATVLMVICKDDDNLSATEVRTRTDEYGVEMVRRFTSTYEDVEIKTDGEPSIVGIARRVQSRRDRSNDSGPDKCWGTSRDWSSGTCEWNGACSIVCVLSGLAGSHEGASHSWHTDFVRGCRGTQCGQWCVTKLIIGRNRLRMSGHEAVDASQRWFHLDRWSWRRLQMLSSCEPASWTVSGSKAVWVGRVDKSNEHLLLTTKGCSRSRVVRCIPDGNQATCHAEVTGLPWDTFNDSAEMLRNATVRPGDPPRPSRGRPKEDGSPAQTRTATTTGREATQDEPMPGSSDDRVRLPSTEEPDVTEQDVVIDTEALRVSDNRPDQGVLRMDEKEGIAADDEARRRLRSTQPARRSLTDDEAVSKRLKREATIAEIKQEILKTVPEGRTDLEQAHKIFCEHQDDKESESSKASRMVEIKKCREREVLLKGGVEKMAMAAGGQMFIARWADEQHKEKSRYVVKDFANTRDPTMFAAASDTAVGRVVEFKGGASKLQHVHVRCDVAGHACLGGRTRLSGTATGRNRGAWWFCVEVGESYLWASQGCKIVAGALSTKSSETRRTGNEVSRWNRIQSVRHFISCVRRMA